MTVNIVNARAEEASIIAKMIMEAMNHECCKWFAGSHHSLQDFHRLMKRLVEQEDSQYSYRNTLVAKTKDNTIVGICVSYEGSKLHELRRAFIEGAKQSFGIDHSDMPDETQSGELYIDSLCTDKNCRGRGIASKLLLATIEKGRMLHLPTGLLVDKGNPKAEKLYSRLGFQYVDDNEWGGHPMRHLLYPI